MIRVTTAYFLPMDFCKLVDRACARLSMKNNSPAIELRSILLRAGARVVAKIRAEWGMIFGHNEAGVLLFERFFVGGPMTVRGFQRNTSARPCRLSAADYPMDCLINHGGTEQLLMNAELEYPIFQPVRIRVFFFDGGNAFQSNESVEDKLNSLRYADSYSMVSPMGPSALNGAFPSNHEIMNKALSLNFQSVISFRVFVMKQMMILTLMSLFGASCLCRRRDCVC